MSLSGMYTGVSGLTAMGSAMAIIGDNIANAGTTAFKASRGEFADVISSNLKGVLGGNQIGRGVVLTAVTPLFSQGNLTPSERDSDMAIRGDGFFVTKAQGSAGEISYTRDGSFRFDAQGRMTTSDGNLIQGYKINAISEKQEPALTDVQFSSNIIPAKGTTSVKIDSNLDVRKPVNMTKFSVENADKSSDYATSLKFYDSTGTAQSLNVYFYKAAESDWKWYATADGGVLQGGKEGTTQQIAEGKLSFTKDGKLASDELISSSINFRGATPNQKIDFNFGDSIITRKGTGLQGTTQYGSNSTIYRQVQDGYAAGSLTNFSIDDTGTVSGAYSNGVAKPLAQIAIARFENNEGLYKAGNNRWKEAVNSGQPLIGRAGEAGRGVVMAKTLESSNVDLAGEFVHMMGNQRNFQANAKTITTSDELLQEVIQLKR